MRLLGLAVVLTGVVVLSLATSGGVKTFIGWLNGTDSPGNLPRNVTEEFSEAGFVVPGQGGGARQPVPYGSTPYGTDLYHQMQQQGR